MIYKEFCEDKLSMLGMGCMRFPCLENGEVDMEKTAELIDLCIKNGVNYFDTAWFYHEGKSEEIIGELLSKYDRSTYKLATKMPWTDISSRADVEKIFNTQLEHTKAEYFDYYLIHNVSEDTIDVFNNEEYGIVEFLYEQKKAGKIRHLGFSTHGSIPLMEEFIVKHKDKLEFCQIQLNWLDWTLQNAKEKVELLQRYGLAIWVMEPVRGGKLASLTEADEKLLKAFRPDDSIASWAFRFLQDIEGVVMILSGMSDREQVLDNIKTFSCEQPLSNTERKTVLEIADRILSKKLMTCTSCRYCVSQCPKELDIPKLLRIYNDVYIMGRELKEKEQAETSKNCIGCGMCEKKCPQKIKISEFIRDFAEKLQ